MPEAAPQCQRIEYGQRPRPWSSTAQLSPAGTSCATPSIVMVPRAGRATSFTVYWNLVSLHGTTTPIAS